MAKHARKKSEKASSRRMGPRSIHVPYAFESNLQCTGRDRMRTVAMALLGWLYAARAVTRCDGPLQVLVLAQRRGHFVCSTRGRRKRCVSHRIRRVSRPDAKEGLGKNAVLAPVEEEVAILLSREE